MTIRSVTEGRGPSVGRVYKGVDPDSHQGAEMLADAIRRHWAARGCSVAVEIERMPGVRNGHPYFAVRSDLVNAKPVTLPSVRP